MHEGDDAAHRPRRERADARRAWPQGGALLQDHAQGVSFLAPDVAFADVHEHLAPVLAQRGQQAALPLAMDKLAAVRGVVQVVDLAEYQALQQPALARIAHRDPDDWPVLACALLLDCPIWTEDQDFFGTGVATWTSASIEQFFIAATAEGREAR